MTVFEMDRKRMLLCFKREHPLFTMSCFAERGRVYGNMPASKAGRRLLL